MYYNMYIPLLPSMQYTHTDWHTDRHTDCKVYIFRCFPYERIWLKSNIYPPSVLLKYKCGGPFVYNEYCNTYRYSKMKIETSTHLLFEIL